MDMPRWSDYNYAVRTGSPAARWTQRDPMHTVTHGVDGRRRCNAT